jgi:hypothetical protein
MGASSGRYAISPLFLFATLTIAHFVIFVKVCAQDTSTNESHSSLGIEKNVENNESDKEDSISLDLSKPPIKDPWSLSGENGNIKFSLSGVAQPCVGIGSWWNLSEQYAPDSAYNPDLIWTEVWLKPGITASLQVDPSLSIYSGLSYVGSGNIGTDVFDQGNRGIFAIEDGYMGMKFTPTSETSLDVSYGRQAYKVGSGMLLAVGAMNGFERGATTSFARRAWEEAGLVKLVHNKLSWDGFYLKPNELRSGDTKTRLAGTKVEYAVAQDQNIGVSYFNVFESEYPYAAAPLTLIPNGRENLNTLQAYTRISPLSHIPGLYFAGDYAIQWNNRINMASNAYSGEIGHILTDSPLQPKLSYCFRSFQGDDPATAKFEKFDPLFYEGAPNLWASGSNGSFSFLNSNIQAHRIQASMNWTPTDIYSFYYWHVRADQLNSPVQFGQAGRIVVVGGEPQLVSGVPNKHLSDDFYIEHLKILNQNWYLTTGFAVSIPGRGLRELVDDPTTWFGALASLAFQY